MKLFLCLFSVFWISQSSIALAVTHTSSQDGADSLYEEIGGRGALPESEQNIQIPAPYAEPCGESDTYVKPYGCTGNAAPYAVSSVPLANPSLQDTFSGPRVPLIPSNCPPPQHITITEDTDDQQSGWSGCKKTLFWFSGFIPGSLAGAATLFGGAYVYAMQNPDILVTLAHYFGTNNTHGSELDKCYSDLASCHKTFQ